RPCSSAGSARGRAGSEPRSPSTPAATSCRLRCGRRTGRTERRSMPRAALFDMDRTLIRKETASLYVRYQRERGEATWRDLARVLFWVAEYTLGVIDAPAVVARA